MLTKKATRRFSLTFFVLTIGLWGIDIYLDKKKDYCAIIFSKEYDWGGVEVTEKGAYLESDISSESTYKWFLNKTRSLSPTHLKLYAACPAVAASTHLSTDVPEEHGNTYIGSAAVLGEIHFPLHETERTIKEILLRNISSYLQDTSTIITSLSVSVDESSFKANILSNLKILSQNIIVSLANSVVPGSSSSDAYVRRLTRMLEQVEVNWLGVNAKKHHVMIMGAARGERFGVLAFCGVQKECAEKPDLAFYPLKYSQKAAKSAVEDLNQHGVTLIIVLMYWGLENSYFPDETALGIARYLSRLGVSVVVGYHPNSVQHHAYFGDTLVIFSAGKFFSSSEVTHNCWKKSSEEWRYSSSRACKLIHPQNRNSLLTREHQSRIYKLKLSKSSPVVAEYTTLKTQDHIGAAGHLVRIPRVNTAHIKWTQACGKSDTHCLSCIPF